MAMIVLKMTVALKLREYVKDLCKICANVIPGSGGGECMILL
jgi:hypothetical protein